MQLARHALRYVQTGVGQTASFASAPAPASTQPRPLMLRAERVADFVRDHAGGQPSSTSIRCAPPVIPKADSPGRSRGGVNSTDFRLQPARTHLVNLGDDDVALDDGAVLVDLISHDAVLHLNRLGRLSPPLRSLLSVDMRK